MQAFRRLMTGDIPASAAGLNLGAVKAASRELYLLDGQIAFDRALLYANIYSSMTPTQKANLDAMKGKGFNSWPDVPDDRMRNKMRSLPRGTAGDVRTYAGDLFSWYAGSLDADVYFCPERHGTYYGGFYIKDGPSTAGSDSVKSQVLALSATYGELDGENNYAYATAFAKVYGTLTGDQKNKLTALRKSIMSGANSDGTAFDFSACQTPFLYSEVSRAEASRTQGSRSRRASETKTTVRTGEVGLME
jgi:hypothetical protein